MLHIATLLATTLAVHQVAAFNGAYRGDSPRALRQTIRMPTTEPMVPWQPVGEDYTQFVPISQRFYNERIIVIGDFLDEAKANNLIATLLYLKQESNTKQITLYFNCPGALMKSCLAVYDTMKSLDCPIMTLNLGLSTGMAAFLCAAGTPGLRYSLPNARFLLQKTGLDDPFQGQAVDIGLRVSDNLKDNRRFAAALAQMTGQTLEKISADLERDFYLGSFEARDYGLIDKVLLPKMDDSSGLEESAGFGAFAS